MQCLNHSCQGSTVGPSADSSRTNNLRLTQKNAFIYLRVLFIFLEYIQKILSNCIYSFHDYNQGLVYEAMQENESPLWIRDKSSTWPFSLGLLSYVSSLLSLFWCNLYCRFIHHVASDKVKPLYQGKGRLFSWLFPHFLTDLLSQFLSSHPGGRRLTHAYSETHESSHPHIF